MSIRDKVSSLWRTPEKRVYFPPVTQDEQKAIHRIVKKAGPDQQRLLEMAAALSASKLNFLPFSFEIGESEIQVTQCGQKLYFPNPIPNVKFTLLVSGYLRWLERKYTLPGFCSVEPGDQVVDCGAFIGGFGLNVLESAKVHFFEPDPENFRCLDLNVASSPSAHTHQIGLYRENGTLSFNRSVLDAG